MSVLHVLLRQNYPLKDIPELPECQRCRNRVATVPVDIGDQTYDLCVQCSVRPPEWKLPTK